MIPLLAALVLLAFCPVQPQSTVPGATTAPTCEASVAGRVKGVVTYYSDHDSGERVDLGAHVYLVRGALDIPLDKVVFQEKDELQIATPAQRIQAVSDRQNGLAFPRLGEFIAIVDSTRVDANGTFQFDDTQQGEYTVVIQSSHVNGAGIRDHFSRYECVHLLVRSGHTTDASVGFSASEHLSSGHQIVASNIYFHVESTYEQRGGYV